MDREEIIKKTNEILINQLGIDAKEIRETAILVDDLGFDSLDEVELVMECEKDFGISITDVEAEKVKTVKDMYDLIEQKAYR